MRDDENRYIEGCIVVKIFIGLLFVFVFNAANADWNWTDGNWQGSGIEVNNVYLQWDKHWVAFTGGDGKYYYYYWGAEDAPDEKGKLFFTMLLTAFTAGKKVSLYRDEETSHGGWNEYTFLNIHN